MLRFTDDDLFAVLAALEPRLAALAPGEVLRFLAPDPDRSFAHYDGELIDGRRHRSLAGWVALAEQLGARLLCPRPAEDGCVRLALRKLDRDASWQTSSALSGDPEKYGVDSGFARVRKFEEPAFVCSFRDALRFVDPAPGARVLAVGCNRGDELDAMVRLMPSHGFVCHGIDHSVSAIDEARRCHPEMAFDAIDLNDADAMGQLGRFDLVLALNVLHSPSLDGKAVLRRLVAEHLTPAGAVMIGLPNVRYVDHGLCYGARVKGFSEPELSVLVRDAAYYRRYLAQHRFRVMITGQHTVFVAARPLPGRAG